MILKCDLYYLFIPHFQVEYIFSMRKDIFYEIQNSYQYFFYIFISSFNLCNAKNSES